MQRYFIRRIVGSIAVIFGVTLVTFLAQELVPGDPVDKLLSGELSFGGFTDEARNTIREKWGLNDPLPVRYVTWLMNVFQLDLGESPRLGRPITDELLARIPVSAQVTVLAWLVATLIAVPIGVISAVRRNGFFDNVAVTAAVAGVAIPNFWLALLLIYVFAVQLNWLPATGYAKVWEDPIGAMQHLALPILALAVGDAALTTRIMRSAMLEVMGSDYLRTAYSKGLTTRQVVLRHALRNAMVPVVTVLVLQVARLWAGSFIIETMFAIPGVGLLAVNAVLAGDYLIVQAVVLLTAVTITATQLVADLIYVYLDPRIAYR